MTRGQKPSDIPIGEFVSLALAGLTSEQIAEELHVSTAALSRWKKRHGISIQRTTKAYDILKRYGDSDKEIAKKWGISQSALYLWKKGRGLV